MLQFHSIKKLVPQDIFLKVWSEIHCWIPKTKKHTRPDFLLLHGFGANAMWQWGPHVIPKLIHHFNVYVPDLVFFGDSVTTRSERSDSFQAECVYRVMVVNDVKKVRVVGLSYGGFVAYSMAVQFKEMVEQVVICCVGVCLEMKDLDDGLFPVKTLEEAAEILLPQTPEKMKELMKFTYGWLVASSHGTNPLFSRANHTRPRAIMPRLANNNMRDGAMAPLFVVPTIPDVVPYLLVP
ncbi:monoacylglycerol lipase ABHD6-like protein isoform X2 [Tanacetum coccineum]